MKPLDPETANPDMDLLEIHETLMREPPEPEEGREKGPWWLWALIIVAIFSAGFYLGRYGGTFFKDEVHVGYLRPSMVDPTGPGGLAPIAKEPIEKIGPRVFSTNCIACHQVSGQGIPGSFPPLANSPWVTRDSGTVIRIVLHGLSGPLSVNGTEYNGTMPAWGSTLSDEQIAGVISYVRSSWGNQVPPATVEQVTQIRGDTKEQTVPWTAQELERLRERP